MYAYTCKGWKKLTAAPHNSSLLNGSPGINSSFVKFTISSSDSMFFWHFNSF